MQVKKLRFYHRIVNVLQVFVVFLSCVVFFPIIGLFGYIIFNVDMDSILDFYDEVLFQPIFKEKDKEWYE